MSFLRELFGTEKPILGLLHLRPLPGDPFYPNDGTIDDVIAAAEADLAALQAGGVDGVLVTNEFSLPYQSHVSPVTTAAMGCVIGAIKSQFTVPFGAEAIYDGDATMDLCAATGAAFTRCVFTGAWSGDGGIVNRDIAHTLRHKHDLRLDDLRLFYFITSEGERNIGGRDAVEMAGSLLFNVRPDAYVVGGSGPGRPATTQLFHDVVAVSGDVPVVCGTGCRESNAAEVLSVCSGAFVGSSFKRDGVFENPIDQERVTSFMNVVRDIRGKE